MACSVDEVLSGSSLVSTVCTLVSLVYIGPVLLLLRRRRFAEPLCCQPQTPLYVANCSAGLLLIWSVTTDGFAAVPEAIAAAVWWLLLNALVDAYLNLAMGLFLSYEVTTSQIEVISKNYHEESHLALATSRRWQRIRSALTSTKSLVLYMGGSAAFLLLFQAILFVVNHTLLHFRCEWFAETAADSAQALSLLNTIGVVKMLISAVFAMGLSYKLGPVHDAFGTKTMLRSCALIGLFGLLLYLALGHRLDSHFSDQVSLLNLCLFVCGHAVFILSAVLPLRRTFIETARSGGSVAQSAAIPFEQFIEAGKGFEAFRDYLSKEFSVEPLFFWKEVQMFQAAFRDVSKPSDLLYEDMVNEAWRICEYFLELDAPLRIDIPPQVSMQIVAEVRNAHTLLHARHDEATAGAVVTIDTESAVAPVTENTDRATAVMVKPKPVSLKNVFVEALELVTNALHNGGVRRFKEDTFYSMVWQEFVDERQVQTLLFVTNNMTIGARESSSKSLIMNETPLPLGRHRHTARTTQ